MARNRKNQSPGLVVGPAVKASVICVFILICCIGYVWQKKQIKELSDQIRHQETRLAELRDKNGKLKKFIAKLTTPHELEESAKTFRLGLALPQPSQIWRLPEPVAETSPELKPERRLAAGRTGSVAAVMEQ